MSIFTRNIILEPRPADPAVMRFLTLGGAVVAVVPDPDRYGEDAHIAQCRGCGWDSAWSCLAYARSHANEHAGECRSMPRRMN